MQQSKLNVAIDVSHQVPVPWTSTLGNLPPCRGRSNPQSLHNPSKSGYPQSNCQGKSLSSSCSNLLDSTDWDCHSQWSLILWVLWICTRHCLFQPRRFLGDIQLADKSSCHDWTLTSLGAEISSSTLAHCHTFGLIPLTSCSRSWTFWSCSLAWSSSSSTHSRTELICSINLSIFLFCFCTFFLSATSSAFHQVALLLSDTRSSLICVNALMHPFPSSWTDTCSQAFSQPQRHYLHRKEWPWHSKESNSSVPK